ncbi:MAG: hypothetical protein HPY64_09025 [Anaerolineae bacterium]|nr:hypothetical protein [Anaerolineae bacterium]
MSVVALPWVMNHPAYRLYDNIRIGYTPGHLWLGAWLTTLIPDPILRLRLSMAVVVTLTLLALAWLARKWWSPGIAVVTAAAYVAWGPVLMDHALYFEVMMGFYTLLALMCWHEVETHRWRIFLAGLLIGLVLITKNQGVLVPGAFILWRVAAAPARNWRATGRDLLLFSLGVTILPATAATILLAQGLLERALVQFGATLDTYIGQYSRWPSLSDGLLLAVWLALVPVYLIDALRRRAFWGQRAMLLALLLLVMLTPVYPRYGRFHLSGAVPFVALMTAGGLDTLWQGRQRFARGAAVVLLLLVFLPGFVLPVYYRIKLGPLNAELDTHYPLAAWVRQETGAPPGTQVWILPDIDPTDNFYPVSGYLPPRFWMQAYFFESTPGVADALRAALEADPPPYVLVIERWRNQIPGMQLAYLNERYVVLDTAEMPNDLESVTLYRRRS